MSARKLRASVASNVRATDTSYVGRTSDNRVTRGTEVLSGLLGTPGVDIPVRRSKLRDTTLNRTKATWKPRTSIFYS